MDQQALRAAIDYDPATGIVVRRKNGRRLGTVKCCSKRKSSKPYRRAYIKGIGHKQLSHLIFFYMVGRWPFAEMDHINGDSLDDRWSNLRECTRQQNEANRGPRRHNKLGLRGVYPGDGRFRAAIYRNGRRKDLGKFTTATEAHAAYLAAAREHDGEFLCAA